jgi:hypothetical protein
VCYTTAVAAAAAAAAAVTATVAVVDVRVVDGCSVSSMHQTSVVATAEAP